MNVYIFIFFIIPIIPLNNNFFYNKDCCWFKKNKTLDYIFLLYCWFHCYNLKVKNNYIFTFNQN